MIDSKNIKIIYSNTDFAVLDKPAGIVVHEGAGETGKTLVDIILEQYPDIKNHIWPDPTRPGIVHRLDKDTSGLIIVAKNPETQKIFQDEFKNRKVNKTYLALVFGKVSPSEGTIKSAIHRSKSDRRRMTTSLLGDGKESITKYKTLNTYNFNNNILSLVEVKPETGRMHQIRVHFKYKGYPVIGDQVYNTKISNRVSKDLNLNRQFLHAYKLKISTPSHEIINYQSDLPQDLIDTLHKLKILDNFE